MLRLLPIGFSFCFPALASAVTLWSGPSIIWAQPASDASDPANWDRLTDAVAITRGFQEGLYNPLAEDGYVFQVSPAGTEWAFTLNNPRVAPAEVTAANFASLDFEPWQIAVGSSPPDSVGQPGVLHLIAEDIYLDVEFTSWRAGPGSTGGFTWTRSTPVPEPGPALLLALGLASLAGSSRASRSRARSASSTPSASRR